MTASSEFAARRLCLAALAALVLLFGLREASGQVVPPAPVVTISAAVKEIRFSWTAVPGALYYVVRESANGAPFAAISSGIPQRTPGETIRYTHPVSVHRHDWLNARYFVEACSLISFPLCSRSPDQGVATLELDAIGTLRAGKSAGAGDGFGYSTALSPDGLTLAVGAPSEDCSCTGINPTSTDDAAPDSGAVYVFAKDSRGWALQAHIKAATVAAGDAFGISVALSGNGNTLAVGSPARNAGRGDVHIFERSGTSWRQRAVLAASNADLGDSFGYAIALNADGTMLAASAIGEDSSGTKTKATGLDNDEPSSGAVYVFSRAPGSASWSQTAFLKGSHSDALDAFGVSLALSSDGRLLVVGSERDDRLATGEHAPSLTCAQPGPDEICDAGSVDIFVKDAVGVWSHDSYLRASISDANDLFGSSLALSGDGAWLAVGAAGEDSAGSGVNGDATDNSAPESGAVYLFTRTTGRWDQQAYVKPSDVDAGDAFGGALAFDAEGSTLAVSARSEDGSSAGVSGVPNEGLTDSGAVFLFERAATNDQWTQTRYIKSPDPSAGDRFGGSAARSTIALSSDGSTLAIPAAAEDGSQDATPDSGAVYLY